GRARAAWPRHRLRRARQSWRMPFRGAAGLVLFVLRGRGGERHAPPGAAPDRRGARRPCARQRLRGLRSWLPAPVLRAQRRAAGTRHAASRRRPCGAGLMLPSPALREPLVRLVETLFIGAIGGAALGLAKFPAGWLSGAIIAVAIAALARRPVRVPPILGQCANIVLGISLGASVTPESVARMSTWPASLAILALAMACGSAAVVFHLHKVHDWDVLSALFASSPGGLSQALALAQETGADLRSVAMVQAMRVLVLSAGLPLCFAAFGISGSRPLANADL